MRILSDGDVRACLPPLVEVVDLVEDALVALAEGRADVRPKSGVHTNPGMFADAMPAAFPERNLLGLKWISIVPDNPVRGLPTATGIMVVNDGTTGAPTCLMTAGELTAVRTAAVSGACVRALAAEGPVAIIGAGAQARSHTRVLEALGVDEVRVWARRHSQLTDLVEEMRVAAPAVRLRLMPSREAAVRDAAVVVTALSIGLTDTRLQVTWPREDALLLPLDYTSSVGPDLAETGLLATDDLTQFTVVREARKTIGPYPTPQVWTGHLLRHPRPEGRITCVNLGSGLADLVVAAAVAANAEAAGAGHRVAI